MAWHIANPGSDPDGEMRTLAEVLGHPSIAAMISALGERPRVDVPAPRKRTPDELDAANRLTEADDLVALFASMRGDQLLTPAALALYDAGVKLVQDQNLTTRRMGYLLGLDAMLASPGAIEQVAQQLRTALAASDPALALVPEPAALPIGEGAPVEPDLSGVSTSPAGSPPLPLLLRDIDDMSFRLEPDGGLEFDSASDGEIIRLAPADAYALALFLAAGDVQQIMVDAALLRRCVEEQEIAADLAADEQDGDA
jgi:hypothetical protein